MGIKDTQDKSNNEGVADVVSKNISLLTGILSILIAIMDGIVLYSNFNYSIIAEEFYAIPRSYFGYNKLIIFLAAGVYFVFLILPVVFKKILREERISKFEGLMYSSCVCFVTGPIVFSFLQIIISTFNLQIDDSMLFILTGIIGVLTFAIYMYLFTKDLTKDSKNAKKQDVLYSNLVFLFSLFTRFIVFLVIISALYLVLLVKSDLIFKELLDKIKAFFGKLGTKIRGFIEELPDKIIAFIKKLCAIIEVSFKKLWEFIFIVILSILVISVFILVAQRIIENPKNLRQYEIVILENRENGAEELDNLHKNIMNKVPIKSDNLMAVVSYKNGKAILMDCTIITQAAINGKEIEILQLTKGKYRLSDVEGYQIEYKEFNDVKCE